MSDDNKGEFSQIKLLFSLFKLDEFIRLKSLKLVEINREQFDQFFEQINKYSLKSLSIALHHQTVDETHRIIEFCSSRIDPYSLQDMLRRLPINDCTYEQYHRILSSCVNLKTLVIKRVYWEGKSSRVLPPFAQSNYPQLTSLTIKAYSLRFKQLCSILSLTPFFVHLHVTVRRLAKDGNMPTMAGHPFSFTYSRFLLV